MELVDRAATERLATRLARALEPGDVLALTGPLGVGKTTLVRALVEALGGHASDVVSPTFALVQHYVARLPVTHVDAYRLGSAAALRDLGHEEVFPSDAEGDPCGATVIEWAELVREALPATTAWIRLEHGPGEARRALATGPTETLARLGLASESAESAESGAAS